MARYTSICNKNDFIKKCRDFIENSKETSEKNYIQEPDWKYPYIMTNEQVLMACVKIITFCKHDIPNLSKDMKIYVGSENYDVGSLIEIDGITVCSFYNGDDWEFPVYMVFYFDHNDKIRVYVPKESICNYGQRKAFGNVDDDEDEGEVIRKQYSKKYPMFDYNVEFLQEILTKIVKTNEFKNNFINDVKERIKVK